MRRLAALALAAVLYAAAPAPLPDRVLLVVNRNSSLSRRIGDYYVHRRSIPPRNVCEINAPEDETIDWATYAQRVEAGVAACLRSKAMAESVLYIVTTAGVPLRISGPGQGTATEAAAV